MPAYLKGWSVWFHGQRIVDSMEYRAPDLAIRTAEYLAGHMDGPRLNDNGIETLTASLKIRGASASKFLSIGSHPFLNPHFTIRSGYVGAQIEDELHGFISKVSQDPIPETGRASNATTIDISLRSYSRKVDGKEKILLIPGEGVRKINGVDILNVTSVMVFLSSLTDAVSDIDFEKLKMSDFIGGGF